MGNCNYSGVIRFSVFTNFLHHRSDNTFVIEFDVLESFKTADIVGCNERHTIDPYLGSIFFKLKRSLNNLVDLAGDVDIGRLSEAFNCLESIARIMVPRDNQDRGNLAQFNDVAITELL